MTTTVVCQACTGKAAPPGPRFCEYHTRYPAWATRDYIANGDDHPGKTDTLAYLDRSLYLGPDCHGCGHRAHAHLDAVPTNARRCLIGGCDCPHFTNTPEDPA